MADGPRLSQGVVASAPVGGQVDVTITSFDGEQTFSACPYLGGTPAEGTPCLVAIDGEGRAWALVPHTAGGGETWDTI